MKKETPAAASRRRSQWIVDESKYLTAREVEKLRNAAEGLLVEGLGRHRYRLLRIWFMTELGLNTGMRVAEMASMDHASLLLEGGRSTALVLGKGGKIRSIWINSSFKALCRRYSRLKARFGYSVAEDSPLLTNQHGERISRRALQKDFKEILSIAGLSSRYYIHCLRHTYTTHLLKASRYNYRFVQRQLGHASIKTTQIYAGVVESDGRRAVEALYGERPSARDIGH